MTEQSLARSAKTVQLKQENLLTPILQYAKKQGVTIGLIYDKANETVKNILVNEIYDDSISGKINTSLTLIDAKHVEVIEIRQTVDATVKEIQDQMLHASLLESKHSGRQLSFWNKGTLFSSGIQLLTTTVARGIVGYTAMSIFGAPSLAGSLGLYFGTKCAENLLPAIVSTIYNRAVDQIPDQKYLAGEEPTAFTKLKMA